MSFRHCEYVGPITELRGQIATVRPLGYLDRTRLPKGTVQAQFHESVVFNKKDMGTTWNPFPEDHFREHKNGDKPYFDQQPLL